MFGRVSQRLDHEPQLHAVFEHAALDRESRADPSEDARAFGQIDEKLERRRGEALGCKIRNGVAVERAGAADFDLFHGAVAVARWAHRHFWENDGSAFPATVAE